jgi:hypothetical protein
LLGYWEENTGERKGEDGERDREEGVVACSSFSRRSPW